MLKTKIDLLVGQAIKRASARLMSTAVEARPDDRLQSFRTQQTDPTKHTTDHLSQFYTIPENTKKLLFSKGGIPNKFDVLAKTFNETCLMVREPALDIINCLNSVNYDQPPVRFALYGKTGHGKSLSLAHVIHYAHNNKFLIVHVWWAKEWMRNYKDSSNSEVREGFIDLNLDAAAWLLHFRLQNAEMLKDPNFKLSREIEWTKRETTPKGASFSELIEHGISRVRFASRTVNVLAEEIQRLSNEGLVKTLVAIDGFNAFFYPHTRVYTEKKEVVPPSRVTLVEPFLNLTKFNWKNAAIVVTLDELAGASETQQAHTYKPRFLLGKEGFEHMDPFIPVEVNEFTRKENKSFLDYYRDRKWIQPYPGQDDELYFLSGGNPLKLMTLCKSL